MYREERPEPPARCAKPDRRSGDDAIIDQDDRSAPDVNGPSVSEIEPSPALDLGKLAVLFGVDVAGVRSDYRRDLFVGHELRIRLVDDRADAAFRVTQCADLGHQQKVERRMERIRDLRRLERHRAEAQGRAGRTRQVRPAPPPACVPLLSDL